MLKVSMPVERANQAIRDGSLPRTLQAFAQEAKPEASYFYAENGLRTALFVFDLKDAAQIPVIAEPFFMALNAGLECYPCMNAEDLKKGLDAVAKRL
jgi:hypothetical protein